MPSFNRKRRRVPTIMQQEAVECGAACLAMGLAYYGRWVALEELRELCGVNRDGTKATNIVKAARGFGLVAKGLRKEVEQLPDLPLPQIVFWNFNHFVVVEGFSGNRVWLNDPATGPRIVTLAEFSDAFTGVVIAFEPGPDFAHGGSRVSLVSMLRERLAGFMPSLGHAMLAGLVLLVPGIAAAAFSRIFIDNVLIDNQHRWLATLLYAMLGMAALRGLLTFLQQRALARSGTALGITLAARQMWAILNLPLSFFSHRFAGDIANRFMMIDRLSGMMTMGLAPAAIALLSIVGYGAVLFALDPVLGAVAAAFAFLALGILSASARGMENASRRQVSDDARFQAATIQGLSMIDDFKISGTESLFLARWSGFQAKVMDAEQISTRRANLMSALSAFVIALAAVAILVVGGVRVMDGAITIGVLLAFQMLMGYFTSPVLSLVGVGGQMQQVRGIAERLDDIVRYGAGSPAAAVPAAAIEIPASGLALSLRNVSFSYAPLDPPFIDNLSLEVPAGVRLALVGGSGSGKSTLGRLIVGLASARSGTIALGGVPLAQWPTTALRRAVAYVDQTIGMFEGAIKDNITLWDGTMPESRIVEAASHATAHGFITARPGGYSAYLTEGGGNLSGGERQRIAIARALAIDPAVLVLDEATSALDPQSEQEIMDAIRRRGCSCIIIAHRLSTIRDCDAIAVLERGRVVEFGTHAALMAHNGRYRSLVEH